MVRADALEKSLSWHRYWRVRWKRLSVLLCCVNDLCWFFTFYLINNKKSVFYHPPDHFCVRGGWASAGLAWEVVRWFGTEMSSTWDSASVNWTINDYVTLPFLLFNQSPIFTALPQYEPLANVIFGAHPNWSPITGLADVLETCYSSVSQS